MPFVYYYKKDIDSYNKTDHNILVKEIPLILPNFERKRGIFTSLLTGFIGLAYEGVSSCLHNKRQKSFTKSIHRCGKTSKFRKEEIFFI